MHLRCYNQSKEIRREMRELGLSSRWRSFGGALVASVAVLNLAATILYLIYA